MKRMLLFVFLFLVSVPAFAALNICLDTGQPIDTASGAILVDGSALQATKTHYVRINFILGPWSSPRDTTLYNGKTWFQTYDQIVNDLTSRGIKVYGLICAQAVNMGGINSDAYTTAYTNNFVSIVGHFKDRVTVYEEFNEPNDWAGGTSAQLTPTYFANQMSSVYKAVKIDHASDPSWQVTLISGPLLSHDSDTASDYMNQTYANCASFKNTYGYYPFDGIGYHLYCAQGTTDQTTIYNKFYANMSAMWNVITSYEPGTSKKFWISEFGWLVVPNTQNTEAAQAANLTYAFGLFNRNSYIAPKTALASWFQICDFAGNNQWGLFRATPYVDANKKQSWTAFYNFANANPQGTGTISGWVKDTGGNVISGATVSTDTGGYSTTTDASGNYTLSSVSPSTYNVTASKTGYNSSTNNNVTVTINNTTTSNLTMTAIPTGSISGWVRTTGGTGISGATVSTNTGGYSTTTDPSGNYTLSTVNTGTYTVTASKSGYNSSNSSVTVTVNTTTTANYTLTVPDTTPPTITNIVPSSTWVVPNGTVTVTANVTDDRAISIANISLLSVNLLNNPSFESSLTGWTNTSNPNYSNNNTYPSPGTAKNGTYWIGSSAGYNSGIKTPEIRQVLNVTPGARYFLSVWVSTDGSPNVCSSYLQWKDGTATADGQCTTVASFTSNTPAGGWKQLYGFVTPTGSQLTYCLKLSWDASSSGGGGNFDLSEVRLAPNPNTYASGVATWSNVVVPSNCAFQVYAKDDAGNVNQVTSSTTVNIDSTAPSTPAVNDDGMYTVDTTQLHSTWTSSDAGSGIVEYQYAIGTTAGGTDIINWTSTGTTNSVTKTGLSLAYDTKYYFSIKAKNGAGTWSSVGNSDGITVARSASTIAEAKGYIDGSAIQLIDKAVTAHIGSGLWIEETDRSSGIKVNSSLVTDLNAKVKVTGKLLMVDGERSLDQTDVSQTGTTTTPKSLFMTNARVGGSSFNAYTPGVNGGVGINNIGLLVQTSGLVKDSQTTYFTISDGSGINLKIAVPTEVISPAVGKYAVVTGISSIDIDGSRLIKVRMPSDILAY